MLEQPLDKGGEWVTVSRFTASRDLINYQFETTLNQRADALLVNVYLDEPEDTWQIAGELIQYWDSGEETFQTAYGKVRLQEKSIIEISPLATSTILFRPVEWLRGWTIEIRARLAPISNRDLINQIATVQAAISASLSNVLSTSEDTHKLSSVSNKLNIINAKLEQLNQNSINDYLSDNYQDLGFLQTTQLNLTTGLDLL